MLRHHTGSGRRRVIPTDWSAHHRPVLATTRTATVTLRAPGGTAGVFDPVTGTSSNTPFAAYYTGTARIQVVSVFGHDVLAAEQEVSTLRYAVTLDSVVSGVALGHLVRVTAVDDNGDVDLVGRDLTVEGILRGSLHWERRLICTDDLETQEA
jgi:hypothetical protein